MSESRLPENVSPALAHFTDVLCMYDLERFGASLGELLAGPPSSLGERAIMFCLAEHAVRVSAVVMLEAQERASDADTLRRLAPITDRATAQAARRAVDDLVGKPAKHARGAALFAGCDPDDKTAPARAAEHAAYAVADAAACAASAEQARKVYDEAGELLASLRAGRPAR